MALKQTRRPQLPPWPRDLNGWWQPQDHRYSHAPGNIMAACSPRPTAPTMPREPTWPTACPRAHSSHHAPGTNMANRMPQGPQLPPCPGNQHGRRQHQAHNSLHDLGNYMAVRQPRDHSVRHALGTKVAGNKHGPTAPAMPQEPTSLVAALGSQLLQSSGNINGGPVASGPLLPPCPGNHHARPVTLR